MSRRAVVLRPGGRCRGTLRAAPRARGRLGAGHRGSGVGWTQAGGGGAEFVTGCWVEKIFCHFHFYLYRFLMVSLEVKNGEQNWR